PSYKAVRIQKIVLKDPLPVIPERPSPIREGKCRRASHTFSGRRYPTSKQYYFSCPLCRPKADSAEAGATLFVIGVRYANRALRSLYFFLDTPPIPMRFSAKDGWRYRYPVRLEHSRLQ